MTLENLKLHELCPFEVKGLSTDRPKLFAGLKKRGKIIELRYCLKGEIEKVVLPKVAQTPSRKDELWKSTCLELFLKAPKHPFYLEFNFSPSLDWQCYHFSGYRKLAGAFDFLRTPHIETKKTSDHFEMNVKLEFLEDPFEKVGAPRAGLSAVIETNDGVKEYLALVHPGARPDFHHPGSFAIEL